MIRFKELCLTESFKEKVNSYNIRNAYIKNFVLRYENLIDWGVVKTVKKSGDDVGRNIQSQIKVILQNFEKEKLDPESKKSMFSTENDINWDREIEILKTEIERGNTEAEQALEQFKESPKESKQQVLDSINEGKRKIFSEWRSYIKYNDQYRDNYAFQYIIMKSILDQDGKTRNPPTPINAAIVANLFGKIKEHPNSPFNIEKSYKSFYSDYLESKNEMIKGTGGDWMKISSKDEDPDNYENNIRDLMSMSYSSWCICQDSFARDYLSKGAFWLYFVEDKKGNKYAEIAIRLVGNNIREIRGATGDQSIPKESEKIIVEFLEKAKDISGGQDFLNKYYREQHDEKARKYFKENSSDLLEYYERHMPSDYVKDLTKLNQEEYEELENSKLLDWWQNGRKVVDDGDPRQTKFEFDTDPQLVVDDDFRFNSLLVGLIYHTGLSGFTRDGIDITEFGYNYYLIDKDINLEEFYEKTKDEFISEYMYFTENGYEGGSMYDVDYDGYINYAKEKDPEGYKKLNYILTDTDYTVVNFIKDHSSDLEDHSVYYGERAGHEASYGDELIDKLKTELPEAVELDGVQVEDTEDGYVEKNERRFQITMNHDSLIEYLLENFEEVEFEGAINWVDRWNKIRPVDYPSDFDWGVAKSSFYEEFIGFGGYFEKAAEVYAENFVENFSGNVEAVHDPDEIIEDIDGIIIWGGNKYRPLISDDSGDNQGKDDADLANKLELAIESNDYTLDFIDDNDNMTMFIVDIPQANRKWAGFYIMDNTLKTSVDPQTMKPISEAAGYLKYF